MDYDTGSARLLIEIRKVNAQINLYGYEPLDLMLTEAKQNTKHIDNVHLFQSLEEIPKAHFDKVTCFEVFEHLDMDETLFAIKMIKGFLKPGGEIIVSVPIETGVAGLSKNIVRSLIGGAHDKNWKNIIRASLNLEVERDYSQHYYFTHIGFRHWDLEECLRKNGLKIVSKKYRPVPPLKGFFNSQVFYTLVVG